MPIWKRGSKFSTSSLILGLAVVLLGSVLMTDLRAADPDVPNDFYLLEATEGLTFASAIFDAAGASNRVLIITTCSNQTAVQDPADVNTLRVDLRGVHPDTVLIKKKRARVSQRNRDNPAALRLTGTGDMTFGPLDLDCERSTATGTLAIKEVDALDAEGIFDGKGSRCTGLTPEEAQFVQETCSYQTFFRPRIDEETGEIRSYSLRGRGIAVIR